MRYHIKESIIVPKMIKIYKKKRINQNGYYYTLLNQE